MNPVALSDHRATLEHLRATLTQAGIPATLERLGGVYTWALVSLHPEAPQAARQAARALELYGVAVGDRLEDIAPVLQESA